MKDKERRYYMGWGGMIVMLGLGVLTWMMTHDGTYALGVFFTGLGAYIVILSFKPVFEMLLLGFGVGMSILGVIIIALITTIIDPLYILVAVLVAVGAGIIFYASKKEG